MMTVAAGPPPRCFRSAGLRRSDRIDSVAVTTNVVLFSTAFLLADPPAAFRREIVSHVATCDDDFLLEMASLPAETRKGFSLRL
jgi:hypothetical protein